MLLASHPQIFSPLADHERKGLNRSNDVCPPETTIICTLTFSLELLATESSEASLDIAVSSVCELCLALGIKARTTLELIQQPVLAEPAFRNLGAVKSGMQTLRIQHLGPHRFSEISFAVRSRSVPDMKTAMSFKQTNKFSCKTGITI